jgi:DNA-binding NarL/FixJ family response regulator
MIDDDLFCLTMYKQLITNLGYEDIKLFQRAEDCFELLVKEQPDVIILDYYMDTYRTEILYTIKKMYPSMRIVELSHNEKTKTSIDVFTYGAMGYIIQADDDRIQKLHESFRSADEWIIQMSAN